MTTPTTTSAAQPGACEELKTTGLDSRVLDVEIWTEQDRFGMYSYDFVLMGNVYRKHDFQSRANALEDARSAVRCVLADIELKDVECLPL